MPDQASAKSPFMNMLSRLGFLWIVAVLVGCDRDKEPPKVHITEPAYDGSDVAFGDIFFVEFEIIDDQADGGLWRVELRKSDGITARTAQAGLWEGTSTGTLIAAFALDAASWPTETMTLAVVADDAAGNRAAAFRDFNYTAADDLPEVFVILAQDASGTSSTLTRIDASGTLLNAWEDLPAAHSLAYSNGTLALADAEDARVHLIDWESGTSMGEWQSATSSGTAPLIRSVKPLGVQAGFAVAHAGGIVAINPSGSLLFERFSEAPWTPVDVLFDGTTCIVWEENPATGNHRLRSWDFQTGATGPIIALAYAPAGWCVASAVDETPEGNVVLVSETSGLTLCQTDNGALLDMCGLLGSGALEASPFGTAGWNGHAAVFARDGALHQQNVGPVTSGSIWPYAGTAIRLRSSAQGAVDALLSDADGTRLVRWAAGGVAPETLIEGLPLNTTDVWLVND